MIRKRQQLGLLLVLLAVILLATLLRIWLLPGLPPGLYRDEAFNGVDERMVLSGHGFPIYFAANNGREPLIFYLQALAVTVFGANALALRLVSVCIGILTVPTMFFAGRVLKISGPTGLERAGPGVSDLWIGVFGAAVTAVSYWALSLSRLGLRAVLLPLFSALSMALFFRAWRNGRSRSYALAGLALAASLYTYTSARLLPLVPLCFMLLAALDAIWTAIRQPETRCTLWLFWRVRLKGAVLMALVGAIVLLPFGVAALKDPELVLHRTGQVSILPSLSDGETINAVVASLQPVLDNVMLTAENFYTVGDMNPRHNLPGRPVNDPLLALLFTIGWLTAFWRIRQPAQRFLLLWLAIMLLPTILSKEAPHSLRAAGALPPLILLCASGAVVALGWLGRRASLRYAAPGMLVLVILISGALTARDYFATWAHLPDLGQAFDLQPQLGAQAVAQLLTRADSNEAVLVSSHLSSVPQMAFAAGVPTNAPLPARFAGPARAGTVRFVLEPNLDLRLPLTLFWSENGHLFSAMVDVLADNEAEAMQSLLANADATQVVSATLHQAGWPRMRAGSLPTSISLQPLMPANSLDIAFADGLRLVGYNVTPDSFGERAQKGGFRLILFLQLDPLSAKRQKSMDDVLFVQLADKNAVWHSQRSPIKLAYLWSWLRQPLNFADTLLIDVPANMPDGRAHFEVGVYKANALDPAGLPERVDVVNSEGQVIGDQANLGAVMIGADPAQADLSGLRPLSVSFGGLIELVGWRASPSAAAANEWTIDLAWRALQRSTTDYTAFLHLINQEQNMIAQQDQPPGGAVSPTSQWVPGEIVRSTFHLQLPTGMSPAELRLRVGLYEPVSGRRLPPSTEGSEQPVFAGAPFVVLPLGG